jgi:hypothetical protein
MKNIKNLLFILMALLTTNAFSQDEGVIVAKSRFERSRGIYLAAGPALPLGSNLGDYSNGLRLEAGLVKRLNKVISIGPAFSYLSFQYDIDKTYPYYYSAFDDRTIHFALSGGDISLLSLGCNLKLNLVPVTNTSMASIYGIAEPFVSLVSRKVFTGSGEFFSDPDGDGLYTNSLGEVNFGPEEVPAFAEESKISGGIHLGFGIEFMPLKQFSFFIQSTFNYTLPISYAATENFLNEGDAFEDSNGTVYYNADNSLFQESFPIVKSGFSALSIQAGVSFNF